MDLTVIIALIVVIPLVLLPVAFVWYLNVSGLYRVISDSRQRAKKQARARRQAEEIV